MVKRIAASVILFCLGIGASGQISRLYPYSSNGDISAGFGWMLPMVRGDMGADNRAGTMCRVDYRHFYPNRAGYSIGAQHIWHYLDVDGNIGLPVRFVCRTDLHDFGELVGNGVRNAMANDPYKDYDPLYIQDYINHPMAEGFLSDVGVFLFSLVNRAEFNAGLTPGYIYGDGRKHHSAYSVIVESDRYDWSGMRSTEVGSRFCLTADVGATLSYRIWHFCLNLSPELHYILTDSYRLKYEPDNGPATTKINRWQFSFLFSLDLIL